MGRPKHGKDSAKTKACAKYKAEGRYTINKQEKARKLAERKASGKKIKSCKKGAKTILMKWDNLIRNTPKSVPYCDSSYGVLWGTSKDSKDEIKKTFKTRKSKKKKEVLSA